MIGLLIAVHVEEVGFATAVHVEETGFAIADHVPADGFTIPTQLETAGFVIFVHAVMLVMVVAPAEVSASNIPIGSPPPENTVVVFSVGLGTFVHALIG